MKVAHIAPERLPVPPVDGGACETVIYELAKELSRNMSVTVFSIPSKTNNVTKIEFVDIKNPRTTIKNPSTKFKKYLSGVIYAKDVAKKLNGQYDIIHIHNRPDFVSIIQKYNKNSKIILHMHNDHLIKNGILKVRYNKVLAKTDLILCVSKYIANNIKSNYPKYSHKVKILNNGVNTKEFKKYSEKENQKIRSKFKLGESRIILYVGRLVPEKGIHVLINAMGDVLKKYPDTTLLVAGSSWFKEDIKTPYVTYIKSISNQIEKNIIFTGYISGNDLFQIYSAADIFVCPSIWEEPFALVCLEALASGKIVISSSVGGLKEMIEGKGTLVPPNNAEVLSTVILDIFNNRKKFQKIATTAQKKIQKDFTWYKISMKLIKYYEELLK